MNEIILQNKNGQVVVSSRDVAEKFEKKHAEVVYAIEGRVDNNGNVKNNGLLTSGISQLSQMFIKVDYLDSMNRTKYEYLMNRDGFSLLAMGFTGKKALEWKLKYIEAFNRMEEEIKQGNYLSEEEKLRLQLFSKDALEVVTAHNKLVELATTHLLQKIEEDKPYTNFAKHVTESSDTVDIGEFAKVVKKENINIGHNRLFNWLRNNKYLMQNNTPYQKYIDSGYFKVIEVTKNTPYGTNIYIQKLSLLVKGKFIL